MSQEEYERQAAECMMLANRSTDNTTKLLMMGMAQAWLKLAQLAEKNRRTDLTQLISQRPPHNAKSN
jgi:hypothetical protein